MEQFKHIIPIQIRFNDIDKFGHVNNTVYFQFYDTAKAEYISTVCPHVNWEKEAIVVVHIDADFISQITGEQNIAVRTRVSKIGNKSFHLDQEVFDTETDEIKCRCMSVMVAFDLTTHQAIPMPQSWVDSINEFEGKDLKKE